MSAQHTNQKKHSRGMVFGVFDGLHPGHTYFLSEAAKRCDVLIVVVTPTEVVEVLKKRRPKEPFESRVSKIKEYNSGYIIVSGDTILGDWQILRDHNPDVVLLGYDQQGISRELDKMNIPYEFLDSHHPELYKSSRNI